MSHASAFPFMVNKLIKELDNASRIVIEIRFLKQDVYDRNLNEVSVISVNGFSSVNTFSQYIASIANCFLEDTREFLFTIPPSERTYFLEYLIARFRHFEKVVFPISLNSRNALCRSRNNKYHFRYNNQPINRIPRIYHDPRVSSSRWQFRERFVSMKFNGGASIGMPTNTWLITDVCCKAWKYSTAWSQQLCYVRQILEEQKRITDWFPLIETPFETRQIQQPKLTITSTRDVLGAFFRVLKEANAFGNAPPGEICRMVVACFSTKNCVNLKLNRLRNVFDVPTIFALEYCINECKNFIVVCERLIQRYYS